MVLSFLLIALGADGAEGVGDVLGGVTIGAAAPPGVFQRDAAGAHYAYVDIAGQPGKLTAVLCGDVVQSAAWSVSFTSWDKIEQRPDLRKTGRPMDDALALFALLQRSLEALGWEQHGIASGTASTEVTREYRYVRGTFERSLGLTCGAVVGRTAPDEHACVVGIRAGSSVQCTSGL